MKTQKTVLLLSASYGSGHVQAAKALSLHLAAQEIETIHIDILKFLPRILEHGLRIPYTEMVKRSPKLWGMTYQAMTHAWALHRYHRSIGVIVRTTKKRLLQSIASCGPEAIICTHPTAAHLLDALVRLGYDIPPYYVEITDYGYHPLWKSTHACGYLLPTKDMVQSMVDDHISKNLLFVAGLPVHPIFYIDYTIQNAKRVVSLPEDQSVYLVMTGGFGLVDPTDIIQNIRAYDSHATIIVIAGKNNLLKQSLQQTFDHTSNVQILGWVTNIHEYMRAADVVVTKPGGMTTTEALTLGKPILYYDPLPGQEEENVAYLTRHHLATSVANIHTIKNLRAWHEAFNITKLPTVFTVQRADQD